ncbi:hypothetical protein P9112_004211 [Eukaryota sp. TZLM1-RC]
MIWLPTSRIAFPARRPPRSLFTTSYLLVPLTSLAALFEYLHCDSNGPLSPDVARYINIIHFKDAFSKLSILVASRDVTAQTVVDALFTHVLSVFGAPKLIHSDNGSDLSNRIFALMCSYLDIKHTLSIPHFH